MGASVQFDTSGAGSIETLITTKTLTKADSGKTFFLNLAGGFTVTLPSLADAAGFECEFLVKTQPTTAYIISEDTDNDTDKIIGHVNEVETDDTEDGASSTGCTFITFVASTAVVGDYVQLRSDGVNWYVIGQCAADGGITLD